MLRQHEWGCTFTPELTDESLYGPKVQLKVSNPSLKKLAVEGSQLQAVEVDTCSQSKVWRTCWIYYSNGTQERVRFLHQLSVDQSSAKGCVSFSANFWRQLTRMIDNKHERKRFLKDIRHRERRLKKKFRESR